MNISSNHKVSYLSKRKDFHSDLHKALVFMGVLEEGTLNVLSSAYNLSPKYGEFDVSKIKFKWKTDLREVYESGFISYEENGVKVSIEYNKYVTT